MTPISCIAIKSGHTAFCCVPAGKNRNLLYHRCGDAGHSVIHQLLRGLALRVAGGEDLAQTCGGAPVVCAYPLQGSVRALLGQCGNGGCRLHSLGSIGIDVGGAQLAVVEALVLVVLVGDEVGQHPYESPADVDRSNGTLTMATNAEFEPWEYKEGNDIVGIDADISKAICDKLGYELKIEDMSFETILASVNSGKADFGAAGMTVTPEREESVDFTDTYANATQVVIVRK